MVLSPEQGRAVLDRWNRKDFAWASWDALGKARQLADPDDLHLARVLEIVDVQAIRRQELRGRPGCLPWLGRQARCQAAPGPRVQARGVRR